MIPKKPWTSSVEIRTFRLFLIVYWLYGVMAYALIELHIGYPLDGLSIFALQTIITPLGLIFGMAFNVVFHEFSHAVVGLIMGRVIYIQIGRGNYVTTLQTGRLKWVVKASPDSGFVLWGVTSLKWARMRHFAVTLAGPVSTSLVFFLLGSILMATPGSNWSTMPVACLPCFLGGMLGGTFILLMGTLLPYKTHIDGMAVETDMLRILQTANLSEAQLQAEMTLITDYAHLSELHAEFPVTIEDAKHLALKYPHDAVALYCAANVMRNSRDTQYLSYLEKALEAPSPSLKHRILLLDEYLTGTLENEPQMMNSKTDALSLELLQIHSDKITSEGTRGSVLIDLGRIDEGQTLLKSVLARAESTIDKTYSNIFLALAEKKQGNLALAREYAKKAVQIDPNCPALKRVADLLPAK